MRSKSLKFRTLAAVLLACAAAPGAHAQKVEGPTPPRRAAAESKQAARKRSENARKSADIKKAVAALLETAEAARAFDDLYYKVKIQAEAADLLWPFDEQSARAILARAWEAATAPGVVPAFRQEGESDDDAIDTALTARRIVIARAAKHDARLAESYMKGLMQGLEGSGGDGQGASAEDRTSRPRDVWRQPSADAVQRLQTAYALAAQGEYKSAAAIVAPVVNEGVSTDLLDLIVSIRAHAPREGDALYLALLERTRADPEANANDVLLLSQPIVSPDLRIFISADGSAHAGQRISDDEAVSRAFSASAAEARRAFFATAAAVLLRPSPAPADGASPDSATYFAVGRLLPFFEREAPQYVPQLNARMSGLGAGMEASRRESLSANMGTLSLAPKNPPDPLGPHLDELARDPRDRDRVLLGAVAYAARRMLWERARTLAARIEDAGAEREARRIITLYQVMNVAHSYDEEADGFERAADFVRGADVPPEFRAAGLAQAAELTARVGGQARAAALLDEAVLFANQAAKEDGRRLTALALVAQSAARINSARTWDVLAALARGANESEDPLAVNLWFEVSYSYPNGGDMLTIPEESLDLEDIFATAARLDFGRTLAGVRTLQDEVTRASATVAAARAALGQSGDARGDKAR
jgi:hypothetical protein